MRNPPTLFPTEVDRGLFKEDCLPKPFDGQLPPLRSVLTPSTAHSSRWMDPQAQSIRRSQAHPVSVNRAPAWFTYCWESVPYRIIPICNKSCGSGSSNCQNRSGGLAPCPRIVQGRGGGGNKNKTRSCLILPLKGNLQNQGTKEALECGPLVEQPGGAPSDLRPALAAPPAAGRGQSAPGSGDRSPSRRVRPVTFTGKPK